MRPEVRAGGKPEGCGVSDSLIRIELITYFHRNPGIENTSMELAEVIGREPQRVESQLNKLVQLNILEEVPSNGSRRYHYLQPHSVAAYVVRRAGR